MYSFLTLYILQMCNIYLIFYFQGRYFIFVYIFLGESFLFNLNLLSTLLGYFGNGVLLLSIQDVTNCLGMSAVKIIGQPWV